MNLVDTHFHLDLWEDPKRLLSDIERSRIYTIAVTNTPSVFHYSHEIANNSKYVKAALGLHPELVSSRYKELSQFQELVSTTRYIGEIGIDGSRDHRESYELQKKVFEKIINTCAIEGSKILTVHSRKAERDIIDIIGSNFPGKVILHWYSGNLSNLNKAIDCGFFFSVNWAMLNSNSGRKIIKEIPKERLLTESDGPFVSHKNMKFSPKQISMVVDLLATQLNVASSHLTELIYRNMFRLLTSK